MEGVRLADAALGRPVYVSVLPPANAMPGTNWPCTIGEWQSAQDAIVTRYRPRITWSERSGEATGALTGSGAELIKRLIGNGSADRGRSRRMGFKLRKYTTTDARSSSDMFRKLRYGISGNRARPS